MCIETPNTWIGIVPDVEDQEDQAFAPFFFWHSKDKETYWNAVTQRGGQVAFGKTGEQQEVVTTEVIMPKNKVYPVHTPDSLCPTKSPKRKPIRRQPPRKRSLLLPEVDSDQIDPIVIPTKVVLKPRSNSTLTAKTPEVMDSKKVTPSQGADKELTIETAEKKISPRFRKPISPATMARTEELKCRQHFGQQYVQSMTGWEEQMAQEAGAERPKTFKVLYKEDGCPYPELIMPLEWDLDDPEVDYRAPLSKEEKRWNLQTPSSFDDEKYIPSSLMLPLATDAWVEKYKERVQQGKFHTQRQWNKLKREYTNQTTWEDFAEGRGDLTSIDSNQRTEEEAHYKVTRAWQELDLVNFPDQTLSGMSEEEPFNTPFFPSFLEDYHPLFGQLLEIPQRTFYRYYTTLQLSNVRSLMGRQMVRRKCYNDSDAECRRETAGFPCYPDPLRADFVLDCGRLTELQGRLKPHDPYASTSPQDRLDKDLGNLEKMMYLPKKVIFSEEMNDLAERMVDLFLTDLVMKMTDPYVDHITGLTVVPDRYLDRWVNGRSDWGTGLCGKGPSSVKFCAFEKCGQVGHDANNCPLYADSNSNSIREPETPVPYTNSKLTRRKGCYIPGAEMATAPRSSHTIGDIEQFAYSDLIMEFLTNAIKFPGSKRSFRRKSDGIGNSEYLYLAEKLPLFKKTFPLFEDLVIRAREVNASKSRWNELEYLGDFFEYVTGVAKHMGYWPILAGIGTFMLNNRYHYFYVDPEGLQYEVPDARWGEESIVTKGSKIDKWIAQFKGSLEEEEYKDFWNEWPGIKDAKVMQTFEKGTAPSMYGWAPKAMVVHAGVAPLLQCTDSPIVMNWWSYYLGVTSGPQVQCPVVEKPWELIMLATKKMCPSSERLTGRALVAQTAAILKVSPTIGAGLGASRHKLKAYRELRKTLVKEAASWLKKQDNLINAVNRYKCLEFPPMVIRFTEDYINEVSEEQRVPTPDFDEDRSRELGTYVDWLHDKKVSTWSSTPRKEKRETSQEGILTTQESIDLQSSAYESGQSDRHRRPSYHPMNYQRDAWGWDHGHPRGSEPKWGRQP